MKKFQAAFLVALGALIGRALGGCVGAAFADTPPTSSVSCSASPGYAIQAYPGLTAAEIGTRVSAFLEDPQIQPLEGHPVVGVTTGVLAGDGFALAQCIHDGSTVVFALH